MREDDIKDHDTYRSGDPRRRQMVDVEGARSVLGVPLISGGAPVGAIILYRREVQPFSEDDVSLIENFAAQAVIAIENVRQFRELQTRLEREAATREILQVISRSRDDDEPVFDVILKNALALCDAPFGGAFLYNDTRTHFVPVAVQGARSDWLATFRDNPPPNDPSKSMMAQAAKAGGAVQVDDVKDTDLYRQGEPSRVNVVDVEGMRTAVTVPMFSGDDCVGVICLYRHEVRRFDEDQIALVESFAAQAVIAIENTRQFRELQTRLEREAATREILQVISKSRDDAKPVFEALLDAALRLCGSSNGALILGEEGDGPQILAAQKGATVSEETLAKYRDGEFPMDAEQSLAAKAIIERKTLHYPDIEQGEPYRQGMAVVRKLFEKEGIRSSIYVPLISNDKGIGCLNLHHQQQHTYAADEIALVETFAAQAVIAIENVRQFKALETLNAELGDRVEEQVGEIERMGRLKRFLSPAVADAVVSKGEDAALSSHRALIATLFCDIRGFTTFCETAEPEETIEFLQTYHEEMGKLISEHGGGVDKRMGDGIMVLFNDPLPCDDPAGQAVELAIAMRARMVGICADWKKLGHRLGFGVGISLGYATVGMVGSEGRYDYTASGTAVNLAARLCDQAEDGDILLSPRAAIAVEDRFQTEPAVEMELKGISAPVEVSRISD